MKIGDIIVIILSIGIAVLLLPIYDDNSIDGEKYVVIKVNGEIESRIVINEDVHNTHEFKFDSNVGAIEIKDEEVRMLKMTKDICPKGICSATGWIYEDQVIVCLPNKIIVEIETIKSSKTDESI